MGTNGNGRLDIERQEFEEGLLELRDFLVAFCRKLTRNQDLAEDLAQDVLLKALRARKSFIAGTNLKAWLFTITRNQFYSDRRRSWRQEPWDQEYAERTLTTDGEVSEAEASESYKRMLSCLACLSEDQSDAIVAVGYLGMSYEDAAETLNCAVGTVKSRVARGRKELQTLFSNATIGAIDLHALKHATASVPKSHRLYRIAKAYEEMFANLDGVETYENTNVSRTEEAWQKFLEGGGMAEDEDDFGNMIRTS